MPEEIKIDRKITKKLNPDLPPSPTRSVKRNNTDSKSSDSNFSDD